MRRTADFYDVHQFLSPVALQQSLSPPRAPPLYTNHRYALLGRDRESSKSIIASHYPNNVSSSIPRERRLGKHALQRLLHPHLLYYPSTSDRITRALGTVLPLQWQNKLRDSAVFRCIADGIVVAAVPTMTITNPRAAMDFIHLGRPKYMTTYYYGEHSMQVIHFYEDRMMVERFDPPRSRGVICFVHGGAWGSGKPWMYRLVARPFMDVGYSVAIIGYRTYPDTDVNGQVDDLESAFAYLAKRMPEQIRQTSSDKKGHLPNTKLMENVLIGHSSGAHIALLMLVKRATRNLHKTVEETDGSQDLQFDRFVGMSGPYNISHHFDFEAGRGVEEISPMKPACGYSRCAFENNSPAILLKQLLRTMTESCQGTCVQHFFPQLLLVHGIEDTTVPFTATTEAACLLRSCGLFQCDEVYLSKTCHQDTVMQIMMGGATSAVVMEWLSCCPADSSAVLYNETSRGSRRRIIVKSKY